MGDYIDETRHDMGSLVQSERREQLQSEKDQGRGHGKM